jgi:hypothetical protein
MGKGGWSLGQNTPLELEHQHKVAWLSALQEVQMLAIVSIIAIPVAAVMLHSQESFFAMTPLEETLVLARMSATVFLVSMLGFALSRWVLLEIQRRKREHSLRMAMQRITGYNDESLYPSDCRVLRNRKFHMSDDWVDWDPPIGAEWA